MKLEQEKDWIMEVFKMHKPNITNSEIDYILWEKTCFPFGTVDMIVKQIENFFKNK